MKKFCKECKEEMYDSSYKSTFFKKVDNFHCVNQKCKMHFNDGKWYTDAEWNHMMDNISKN